MRKVIIESPYGTNEDGSRCTSTEIYRNVLYAKACVLNCLTNKEAPYASHLFFPQVLDDGCPEERALGITAGLVWGDAAEMTVVYTDLGITKGMEMGIRAAEKAGRPVEYRSLEGFVQ